MYRIQFLFAFFIFASPLSGQQTEKEDLSFLVIETITRNPEIAAETFRMDAAGQRVPQAAALDDPQIIFKVMEIPGTSFNRAMYQNIELMQMVMFPTKLWTRRDIAAVQAEHAHHEHIEQMLSTVTRMKSAYAMLWSARTSLKINRENQHLLRLIAQATETQFGVGKATQQDALKARIELAKAISEEVGFHQNVTSSESMLRALLNRPPSFPIGRIVMDSIQVSAQTLDDLLAYGLANRPMLVHDSLSIYESDLMVSMAKQEYIPDFRFSLEYVRLPLFNEKRWSIMAGISIPFAPWTLGKASARVEEAGSERSMRRATYEGSRNMVAAQIRDAYAKTVSFRRQVELLERTILPQALQSFQSLLADYQTGRTSYLMLIDGYRMYQDMRMSTTMTRMNYEQAIAELERQVGVTDLSVVPHSQETDQ